MITWLSKYSKKTIRCAGGYSFACVYLNTLRGKTLSKNSKRTPQALLIFVAIYVTARHSLLKLDRTLMQLHRPPRKASGGTASPPDVWRWLCPAGALHLSIGLRPRAGLAPPWITSTCLRTSIQQISGTRGAHSASGSSEEDHATRCPRGPARTRGTAQ